MRRESKTLTAPVLATVLSPTSQISAHSLSVSPRLAKLTIVPKPWGSNRLLPWCSCVVPQDEPVGEVWFNPSDGDRADPALLLKLLFTEQKLSVQVHPNDLFAHSIGLPNGKSEAWYVLSADKGSQVGLGLKRSLDRAQLRAAIEDGSIAELIAWRGVQAGDVIYVPAGTIHAIGPGLVLAEVQQRSDATFRMFDYGRERPLHVDQAVAVAKAEPFQLQNLPVELDDVRSILVQSQSFVLERITLAPLSAGAFDAPGEAWVLPIAGVLTLGGLNLHIGQAGYLCGGRAQIRSGKQGATALVAYPGGDITPHLVAETSRTGVFI